MTDAERKLWYEFLNSYPLRFRRQVTVGTYILDFYCAKAKLAVELDGAQHFTAEGKSHDAKRTLHLESVGIHVIRYKNQDVLNNFGSVCRDIHQTVNHRIAQLSDQQNP